MDDKLDLQPIEEEVSRRTIVWILLGIIALGCGLLFILAFLYFQPDAQSLVEQYFPSPTATITRSPTSTSTPTPNRTATIQAYATHVASLYSQWPLIISDTFSRNENQWEVGKDSGKSGDIVREIMGGEYRWIVFAKDSF